MYKWNMEVVRCVDRSEGVMKSERGETVRESPVCCFSGQLCRVW